MKKLFVVLLVVSLLVSSTLPVFAINPNDEMCGDIYYDKQVVGNTIVVTSYADGIKCDQAILNVDSNLVEYESYVEGYPADEVIDISAYVEVAEPGISPFAAGYFTCTGNIGSVKYMAVGETGNVFRTLTYMSALTGSESITKTFNAVEGQAVTVIALLVSVALPSASSYLIRLLLSYYFGSLTGTIAESFQFTLDGTAYYYNVTARSSDGRTSTEYGDVYYGKIIKDGNNNTYRTVYCNCYPEFIKQSDNGVASQFYYDFYGDTFSVYQYYPA